MNFSKQIIVCRGKEGIGSMTPQEYNLHTPDCGKLYRITNSISSTNKKNAGRIEWESID